MKIQDKSGMTLVEVMVVIAILLILAAFTGFEILKAQPNLELRSLAHDVLATMQRARSLAVQKNINVRVDFTGDGYKLVEDSNRDGDCDDADDNVTVDIKFADYDDARRVASCGGTRTPDSDPVEITFTSRGTANANTIYLDNGLDGAENHHCYEIGSLPTGSVKLEKK